MPELDVTLVTLEPMLVASAFAYGHAPEAEAWQKLTEWARARGALVDPLARTLFGFNNPPAAAPHLPYGYEFWLEVDRDAVPAGDIRLGLFYGGPYAVARCDVRGGNLEMIPQTWRQLFEWCQQQGYQHAFRPGLEKHLTAPSASSMSLELYFPLRDL